MRKRDFRAEIRKKAEQSELEDSMDRLLDWADVVEEYERSQQEYQSSLKRRHGSTATLNGVRPEDMGAPVANRTAHHNRKPRPSDYDLTRRPGRNQRALNYYYANKEAILARMAKKRAEDRRAKKLEVA